MRILLAEDDRVSQRAARQALERAGHDVEVVGDGEQAWERLLADPDRLLVTDWLMPNMDGIELIRRVRAGTFSSYVYTIIVTGLDDPGSTVQGLLAGADDYLAKPYDQSELVARVGVGTRIVALERELRESRQQLRELTTLDATTGLLNQQAIMARAREEAARAADSGRALSVALLTIDGLDEVARVNGRARADEVLRAVARGVRAELRPYDALGRWRGDARGEFLPDVRWGGDALLLVLVDMEQSQAVAEVARLRSALSRFSFQLEGDGAAFIPTFAVGIGGSAAGMLPNVDEMLASALAGLSRAGAERASA